MSMFCGVSLLIECFCASFVNSFDVFLGIQNFAASAIAKEIRALQKTTSAERGGHSCLLDKPWRPFELQKDDCFGTITTTFSSSSKNSNSKPDSKRVFQKPSRSNRRSSEATRVSSHLSLPNPQPTNQSTTKQPTNQLRNNQPTNQSNNQTTNHSKTQPTNRR